jgi:hypothetical protein
LLLFPVAKAQQTRLDRNYFLQDDIQFIRHSLFFIVFVSAF